MTVHRDETKLRLRGSMPPYSPPPPSPRLAFEKFTFSIYIYTQNFTFVPKIIYFTPSLKKIYKLTHEIPKMKNLLNSTFLSRCLKNIKKNFYTNIVQFTNLDNKKNLEKNLQIWIIRKIFEGTICVISI